MCLFGCSDVIFYLNYVTNFVRFQLLQDYWLAKKMYFQSNWLIYFSSFGDCDIVLLKCCEHPYLPQSHAHSSVTQQRSRCLSYPSIFQNLPTAFSLWLHLDEIGLDFSISEFLPGYLQSYYMFYFAFSHLSCWQFFLSDITFFTDALIYFFLLPPHPIPPPILFPNGFPNLVFCFMEELRLWTLNLWSWVPFSSKFNNPNDRKQGLR